MSLKNLLRSFTILALIGALGFSGIFTIQPAYADEIVGHRDGKDIYQDSKTGRYYYKEWITVMETRYKTVTKSRTAYKTVEKVEYYQVPVTKYRTETYYVDVKKTRQVPYTVTVEKKRQERYWGILRYEPVYKRVYVCSNYSNGHDGKYWDPLVYKYCGYEYQLSHYEAIYGWLYRWVTYYETETRYRTETYYVKEKRTRQVAYTDYETRSRIVYEQVPYTEYYTVEEPYQVPVQKEIRIEYIPELVVKAPSEISLDKDRNEDADKLKEKNKRKIFGTDILQQIQKELDRGIYIINPEKNKSWYYEWQTRVSELKSQWMNNNL